MKNRALFRAMAASAAVLGLSLAAHAQVEGQKPPQPAQKKPAAKARKVWSNDDLTSLHSPADVYLEKKEAQDEAAAKQAADSQQPSAAKPVSPSPAPLLSNPKTVEDADRMIAWEKRDIDAQQEYLDRLRKQLEEARAEDKERLQKLIQERTQVVADTRKEMEGLMAQKKGLEKKPAPGKTTNPPPQPPPQ